MMNKSSIVNKKIFDHFVCLRRIMMFYKKRLSVDEFASAIEDFLTENSVIPVLGTIPAVLKIVFGAIQTLCAATTLVASTFFLMTRPGQEIWFNSFRHVLHGLSNILAGALQAIPLIGTLVIGIQHLRNAQFSAADNHYTNNQSHKFFGYKSLEDTSWRISNCMDEGPLIKPETVPTDGWKCSAFFSF